MIVPKYTEKEMRRLTNEELFDLLRLQANQSREDDKLRDRKQTQLLGTIMRERKLL